MYTRAVPIQVNRDMLKAVYHAFVYSHLKDGVMFLDNSDDSNVIFKTKKTVFVFE